MAETLKELLAEMVARGEATPYEPPTPEQIRGYWLSVADGYIYVLGSVESDFVKIGRSKNYDKRIAQLKIQLPFKVKTVAVFATTKIEETESMIHEQFAAQRVNGEWFKLSHDERAYLISYMEPISARIL